jgi:aminopeptidase N
MVITVDTAFVTLSNGLLNYSVNNPDGTRTDYWEMKQPHAPYLFMMAIGKFKILKDKWRNKEVNYYLEPKFFSKAQNIFGRTPKMMEFFSNKLGVDFPWPKYHSVIVRDYVSGAMENTSASLFMEALQNDDKTADGDNWDNIVAHELFHQWFGDLVTCESWPNLPLNESFATFAELLWTEHSKGQDALTLLRLEKTV